VYNFQVIKDSGDYLSYPITPPTDNEWLRGLPNSIEHFKKELDSSYKKVKKTQYLYLYGNDYYYNNPNAPMLIPSIFTPSSIIRNFNENVYDDPNLPYGLLYDKTRTNYRLPLVNLFYLLDNRSEERRVGKECRSWLSTHCEEKQ